MVRPILSEDSAALARIYNHYIEHTIITFEETVVTGADMAKRVEELTGAGFPWFVYEEAGEVIGYAYAGPFNKRASYRHTVESTVYLDHKHTGRGIGRALYGKLFEEIRGRSMHCIIGGISLPNPASVAIHESFGFEKVAHYKEVGRKFDRWIDVGYWQLML